MKQLSIIIPVYNGESYLRRCLDSIMSQAGIQSTSLEVILINDGSNDASLAILEEYTNTNSEIFRLIDQANMGAAATRNKGIQLAKGKFVTLIDQDDWIDDDYCKTFLEYLESDDLEVVQSGFKLVDMNKNVVRSVYPTKTEFGRLLAIPAWAKIYKTSFLRDNDITFFENNIGEDNIFTLNVYLLAQKYKTLEYVGYNNSFDNTTNVTNTLHKGLSEKVNFLPLLDAMKKVTSSDRERQKLLDYNTIRTCVYYLLSYGRYASSQRFQEVNNDLFSWMKSNIQNFTMNRYVWKRPAGEHLSASFGIKLLIFLNLSRMINVFAAIYCRKST